MPEYLGSYFSAIYLPQSEKVRGSIKKAEKNSKIENVNPRCCIFTEKYQDLKKVDFIVNNFDIRAYYETSIVVFNWGGGLLVRDGHHRILVAIKLNINPIKVSMSRYQVC